MRSFYGNFGILVRAYAYILAMGGNGLTHATRMAILNANYLRKRLESVYTLATHEPCMHECVFSDRSFHQTGIKTLDIAKRLLDYGFYAPTIYFPLVVSGALMIEPTETETKETLDEFADALLAIAQEMTDQPDLLKQAPFTTPVSRPGRNPRRPPAGLALESHARPLIPNPQPPIPNPPIQLSARLHGVETIHIRGARQHNLKNISLEIPRQQFVCHYRRLRCRGNRPWPLMSSMPRDDDDIWPRCPPRRVSF